MTTSLAAQLAATIQAHIDTPHSGLNAGDKLATMVFERRASAAEADAALVLVRDQLAMLARRELSPELRTALAAIAAQIEDAPSFVRDAKAEAIAASNALIRGRFRTQGVDLPGPDPEEPEEEEAGEDGAEDVEGWQDLSFGDEEKKPGPSLSTQISTAVMPALLMAAQKTANGYEVRNLLAMLHKVQASDTPVVVLAQGLDRYATLLGQAIPIMALDSQCTDLIAQSQLAQEHKDLVLAGIAHTHAAIADGASPSSAILAAILEVTPD